MTAGQLIGELRTELMKQWEAMHYEKCQCPGTWVECRWPRPAILDAKIGRG